MVVVRSKHKLQKLLTSLPAREGREPRCGSPHWLLNLPLFRFQGASSPRGPSGHTAPASVGAGVVIPHERRTEGHSGVRGGGRLYRGPSGTSTRSGDLCVE